MLKKLKQLNDNKGFTIIEVMIVLAIAGLIMLIVFLAIPALQRNGRNTQRKNDAGNLSGAYSTYLSNNNGAVPVGIGNGTNSSVDFCANAGTASGVLGAACGAGNLETAKIGYFQQNQVWINNSATAAAPQTITVAAAGSESTTAVTTQSMLVVLNSSCGANNAPGTLRFNSRSVAILYVSEAQTGNGSLQCTGS